MFFNQKSPLPKGCGDFYFRQYLKKILPALNESIYQELQQRIIHPAIPGWTSTHLTWMFDNIVGLDKRSSIFLTLAPTATPCDKLLGFFTQNKLDLVNTLSSDSISLIDQFLQLI